MKRHLTTTAAITLLIAALLPAAAHAQIGDLIKGATQGSGSSSQGATGGLGGLGNLGGMGGMGGTPSLGSLTSGSTGNVAGVLEFCIKNNYLGGASGAASVKDKLLGRLGGAPASDAGYADGAKGILTGSDGSKFDLSGDGLKKQITKQACDKILSQGKSLL
ncbi:DUF2501 domain-containing protein [Ralstonia sp. UBA689]|uniref:DUF2501 domain-containing protein n=1 Tax=Ralstonia sp. UBA689 TaxID=1947373 RepID=UPI0025D66BD0|nr:DUF2501 domain-containing protein [Ralstonia sp. UBA689]